MSLRVVTRALCVLMAALGLMAARQVWTGTAGFGGWTALVVALLFWVCAGAVAALRWMPPPTTAMMRRVERSLGGPGRVQRTWTPLTDIAPAMRLAAIAAEDAYFRDHGGFDWESIRMARAHNQTHEQKRGASTISQQVAKNLFLWPGRSYLRKGLEAGLTLLIEALWPKARILEVYLNIAQFGAQTFGVEAAAQAYYGKPARALSGAEAALLAASLPNPVIYRVDAPSHQMRFRQSWILHSMEHLGERYLRGLS